MLFNSQNYSIIGLEMRLCWYTEHLNIRSMCLSPKWVSLQTHIFQEKKKTQEKLKDIYWCLTNTLRVSQYLINAPFEFSNTDTLRTYEYNRCEKYIFLGVPPRGMTTPILIRNFISIFYYRNIWNRTGIEFLFFYRLQGKVC